MRDSDPQLLYGRGELSQLCRVFADYTLGQKPEDNASDYRTLDYDAKGCGIGKGLMPSPLMWQGGVPRMRSETSSETFYVQPERL